MGQPATCDLHPCVFPSVGVESASLLSTQAATELPGGPAVVPSSCRSFATTTQPVADCTWTGGFRSETLPLSTAHKSMLLSSLVIAQRSLEDDRFPLTGTAVLDIQPTSLGAARIAATGGATARGSA